MDIYLNQQIKPIQVIYGKPTLPRCQQPCMFEILSWGGSTGCLEHFKKDNNPVYFNKSKIILQSKPSPSPKELQYQNFSQVQKNEHNSKNKSRIPYTQIKTELYSYQPICLRRSQSQQPQKTKTSFNKEVKKQQKKLDQNDEQDRKIIQERKNRIQKFNLLSRQLPNSSSATYFGKPIFETYGRCNTSHMKSHNVMPHKGKNHPKTTQSYISALIKGKKIKQQNHVPRVPIGPILSNQEHKIYQEQQIPINLPLQSPDLINHIRFATQIPKKKKPSIPSQRIQKNNKIPQQKNQKKSKNKNIMTQSQNFNVNDGLKYMNKRENLLAILEQKKTNKTKLAFKITQCYPIKSHYLENLSKKPSIEDWQNIRPAGKINQNSDSVENMLKL